jgi:hypothetical protein
MSNGLGGRSSIPGRDKIIFSLLPSFHIGSGANPFPYPVGTGALSLGVKAAEK